MSISRRYTSADLELLPNVEGVRYEIIDGDLYVSSQPDWHHQYTCHEIGAELRNWDRQAGLGVTIPAPGLVFAEDDDVAPDLIWVSRERLAAVQDKAGHLSAAPELVVEVLSPGSSNVRRDREIKLALYSRRGVEEYWIVDWRRQTVEIYRREQATLRLVATLGNEDMLTSPLLPDFASPIAGLWPPSL
ncbi:MAG TPA: Uma2 family endonuclease [Chloroflexota bacterium]|nr:Uma2 family endonuclease [Chloroflexota bacterium]